MGLDVQVKFHAPQGTSELIPNGPYEYQIDSQLNYPAVLTASFLTDWDLHKDETAGRPVQVNSYVTVVENGVYRFRGKVRTVPRTIGGEKSVQIMALDKMQTLNDTNALYEPSARYDIDSIDSGTKTITIAGVDATAEITKGSEIYISFNDDADGDYTVASVAFGTDTEIVVNETIATSAGGGYVMLRPTEIWHRYTPALSISALALYPGEYYEDGNRHVYWPAASSTDAWLSDGVSNTTLLGSNMANNSTDIDQLKMATSFAGFLPTGFFKVDSEWCQYNGYRYNEGDGFWYVLNVRRAMLGTSAAGHTAGATVYSKVAKRIHFDGPIVMEADAAGTWEKIGSYAVNEAMGAFVFSQDPLTLRKTSTYASVRCTYPVYDEEGADVLLLADLIAHICEANPAKAGGGMRAGYTDSCTVDTSGLPDIVVCTAECHKPTKILDFIALLLAQLGLNKGNGNDLISYRYDAASDTLIFEASQQKADSVAADFYANHPTRRYEEVGIDNIKTYIVAGYQQGSANNLVAPRRCWNTPGDPDQLGGATVSGRWAYTYTQGQYAQPVATFPGTYNIGLSPAVGYNNSLSRIADNNDGTGIGIFKATSAPSAEFGFYAWWDGASATEPDVYTVEEVVITFEVIGESVSGAQFGFEVWAFDEFTGSTSTSPPTTGGAKYLGRALSHSFTDGILNQSTFTVQASELNVNCRAIGIYFTGFLRRDDLPNSSTGADLYGWILKDIFVRGRQDKAVRMRLRPEYNQADPAAVTAPETAAKAIDATIGNHLVYNMELGPATREVALSLAQLQLIQSLLLERQRVYDVAEDKDLLAGIPTPGSTVEVNSNSPEIFRGFADNVVYSNVNGERSYTVRLTDYDSTVFGSTI